MTSVRGVDLGLRILVAAALAVDAIVHLRLAGNYTQASASGPINEGTLFRIEAVAAIVIALFVLLRGGRIAFGAAFLIAFSAFGSVLLYRYVNVPAIGPLPSMYEPIWFGEKSLSAIAEGIGAVLAGAGFLHTARLRRVRRTRRAAQTSQSR